MYCYHETDEFSLAQDIIICTKVDA